MTYATTVRTPRSSGSTRSTIVSSTAAPPVTSPKPIPAALAARITTGGIRTPSPSSRPPVAAHCGRRARPGKSGQRLVGGREGRRREPIQLLHGLDHGEGRLLDQRPQPPVERRVVRIGPGRLTDRDQRRRLV